MSKKDLIDWGPVPGQLELDLDGDATGRDTHSGQHEDVFRSQYCICPGVADLMEPFNRDCPIHGDEIDQDDFVDFVHRGEVA